MYLTLEARLGQSIAECAKEAIRIATLLGIGVKFRANGVTLICRSDSTPEGVEKMYWEGIKQNQEGI